MMQTCESDIDEASGSRQHEKLLARQLVTLTTHWEILMKFLRSTRSSDLLQPFM